MKALANAYSPFFGKEINPETEIVITTWANEGMLSALMAFVSPGEEVIVFEPFFDQSVIHRKLSYLDTLSFSARYIRNIQLAGGVVKNVPLTPPTRGATDKASASEWTLDIESLARTATSKTKMIVSLRISGTTCTH